MSETDKKSVKDTTQAAAGVGLAGTTWKGKLLTAAKKTGKFAFKVGVEAGKAVLKGGQRLAI